MIDGAYADTLSPMGESFCDPYKNYSCLDSYLGDDFITRSINYYRLEWGHEAAPSDPKAPPSRRDYWPGTPQSTPPMPFTEWPYGASTPLSVTRPSSIDSPLMNALSNTKLGQSMNENHIQVYGWIDAGGNVSNETVRGRNWPAAARRSRRNTCRSTRRRSRSATAQPCSPVGRMCSPTSPTSTTARPSSIILRCVSNTTTTRKVSAPAPGRPMSRRGWQHWFSPRIEIRPEFTFYRSLDAPAFNGNSNLGIAPNKYTALIGAADIIIH